MVSVAHITGVNHNKLSEQREELQGSHTFIEQRDQQMREEMNIMLCGIREMCTTQDKGKERVAHITGVNHRKPHLHRAERQADEGRNEHHAVWHQGAVHYPG